MPDLFIRGLHLPKSLCGEETHVDIRIFSDGTVIMATGRPPYYKKFDAVPIPAGHGRLGDLDALLEQIRDSFEDAEKWRDAVENDPEIKPRAEATMVAFWECGAKVKMAPTIVPAEGTESE